jgi:hypothetical protein
VTSCRGNSEYNSTMMIRRPLPEVQKRYYYGKMCLPLCPRKFNQLDPKTIENFSWNVNRRRSFLRFSMFTGLLQRSSKRRSSMYSVYGKLPESV